MVISQEFFLIQDDLILGPYAVVSRNCFIKEQQYANRITSCDVRHPVRVYSVVGQQADHARGLQGRTQDRSHVKMGRFRQL